MPQRKQFFRLLTHLIFQPKCAKNGFFKKYCSKIHNKKILEIGSGKRVNGKLIYSVADFFKKNSNEVTLSDVNPKFNHKIVDITKSVPKGFDVIVCANVMEHVFDFNSAIKNLHKALKNGGQLLIYVPVFYPLHDEPSDYWRYTEHSLRKLLSRFKKVDIDYYGKRELPFFYFVIAIK
tara:strand:+ start:27473 stop:28006 length:534 start_codon:yes stop_codon:yes gene_type:complete